MLKKSFYLAILIILFFTFHLSAQEKVPTEKTFLDSAIVEYIPGSLENSNLIIEKLKESFSGDVQDFKIHFQFNLLLSSNPNSTGNVVTIQFLNIKITDEIKTEPHLVPYQHGNEKGCGNHV